MNKCPRCENEKLVENQNFCQICGLDLRIAPEILVQDENEGKKQSYLIKFKKAVYPTGGLSELEPEMIEIGDQIINILKGRELTYVDSYVTLEYVYRKLKFMSEYTHL